MKKYLILLLLSFPVLAQLPGGLVPVGGSGLGGLVPVGSPTPRPTIIITPPPAVTPVVTPTIIPPVTGVKTLTFVVPPNTVKFNSTNQLTWYADNSIVLIRLCEGTSTSCYTLYLSK